MVNKDILPTALKYTQMVAQTAQSKRALLSSLPCNAETELVVKLSSLTDSLVQLCEKLRFELKETKKFSEKAEKAMYYRTHVFPAMQELRAVADDIEPLIPSELQPYPTYSTLLFSLN